MGVSTHILIARRERERREREASREGVIERLSKRGSGMDDGDGVPRGPYESDADVEAETAFGPDEAGDCDGCGAPLPENAYGAEGLAGVFCSDACLSEALTDPEERTG